MSPPATDTRRRRTKRRRRFAAYQERFIRDRSRLCLWVKSRRIGGSFAVAYKDAIRASGFYFDGAELRYDPKRGVDQQIISSSHERSIDLLAELGKHLEVLSACVGKKLVTRETKTVLELSNGVSCYARAPNHRTVRGGKGDVTLDEFGAMPYPGKIWAAAAPMADRTLRDPEGFCINVVGTPLGDDNKFYELACTEKGAAFSRHRTTIFDAIREGFPRRALEEAREKAGDGDTFEQEYNCAFLSAVSRYISADLYDSCLYDDDERPKERGIGYAGYDVAVKAGGDLAAIVELRRVARVLWHDRTETRRGASWDDQEAWVAEVLRRCARMAGDASGMGSQHADRMQKRYPTRFEPFEFTSSGKEILATGTRLVMETHRLRLRRDDDELRRDVLSLRREQTKHGNVRFDAERRKDETGKGYTHADRAWALALAVHAAGRPVSKNAGDTPGTGSETDRHSSLL